MDAMFSSVPTMCHNPQIHTWAKLKQIMDAMLSSVPTLHKFMPGQSRNCSIGPGQSRNCNIGHTWYAACVSLAGCRHSCAEERNVTASSRAMRPSRGRFTRRLSLNRRAVRNHKRRCCKRCNVFEPLPRVNFSSRRRRCRKKKLIFFTPPKMSLHTRKIMLSLAAAPSKPLLFT